MSKDKYVVSYCHSCKRKTNHSILFSVSEMSPDEDYYWKCDYQVVRCCGCDEISFRTSTMEESEISYDEDGNEVMIPRVCNYPHKEEEISQLNSWNVPADVSAVLTETIKCLNTNCLRLAAAGCRAVVEAICKDKTIVGKTLEQKINSLSTKGLITRSDRDRLHAVRFMGNDSIHLMQEPDKEELLIVFDIVRIMVENMYLLEHRFRQLSVKPIKTMNEFIELLEEQISIRHLGDVDILRNFLPKDRRIIKEDLPKFEKELQIQINDGKYDKLSMCPAPQNGKNQQYKIEKMP